MKVYQAIAIALQAMRNCHDSGNTEWHEIWMARLKEFEHNMPHGSGFDNGTKLDLDASNGEKLVFETEFHHMGDHGMYVRWTAHTVTVTPSLLHGVVIKVGGRDYREIKDYIGETFHEVLNEEAAPLS